MKHLSWISLIALTGCLSSAPKPEPIATEKEYKATYEATWRAVQQTIISYPLKTNNMDVGQIQTASIRGTNLFKVPFKETAASGGHRYSLSISVIKAGPKRTRVSIVKDGSLYRNFISDPEEKATDGLEEMVLLYRIGRELDIEKAVTASSGKKTD